ncbi:hypothetical protein [Lacrimispora amygdalina]|uniref:hypothetical protein n=1 Tax=Lacrimispora amygdalina TaxID=253257 RepID=UPI000BE2F5EB|nr:hypothetical protein [Lacrimispora amygdalina]
MNDFIFSKKNGFLQTLWKSHREAIESFCLFLFATLIIIDIGFSVISFFIFLMDCLSNLYKESVMSFNLGCYNAMVWLLVFIAYQCYILIRKTNLLQTMPITKQEFESVGCKTQVDVMVFVMLYKYINIKLINKKMLNIMVTYPNYVKRDMIEIIKSFPSALTLSNNIELSHDIQRIIFKRSRMDDIDYDDIDINSESYWSHYTKDQYIKIIDKQDYQLLKPYITKELLLIFDKKISEIDEKERE